MAAVDGMAPADLLIVGGGINGAGIARDAAGRGLSVVLCEKGDLAAATSSASSKLVHGGLRYLEHFAFRLVREALNEREVLLAVAPHIVRPMTFVLPQRGGPRPLWMLAAGLWLYDRLGRRRVLTASRRLDLTTAPEGAPLKNGIATGFAYADAWADDARLVILNALDAHEHGAEILTRTELLAAEGHAGLWVAHLRDTRSGRSITRRARVLVNAAGPWAGPIIDRIAGARLRRPIRLVKGSHIVVPRLYEGDHAYILPNDDGRVEFAIPFEGAFTIIGTTDVEFTGDPAEAVIDDDEIRYLCAAASGYFERPVNAADVVWTFSGVRPLRDDGGRDPSEVTRDYALDMLGGKNSPPLLSVFGGKITTYRRLAEKALAMVARHIAVARGPWTAVAPLPGGDFDPHGGKSPARQLMREYDWLPAALAHRYARLYGTRTFGLLSGCRRLDDLGADLGAGLYEREAAHLVENEWAERAEDILWRRTKLGLTMGATDANKLARWLEQRVPALSRADTMRL